jgi:hypothetical protein
LLLLCPAGPTLHHAWLPGIGSPFPAPTCPLSQPPPALAHLPSCAPPSPRPSPAHFPPCCCFCWRCAEGLAPPGRLVVGLNPPFGKNNVLADRFVMHAAQLFRPRLIVLIVPPGTLIPPGYRLLHENLTLCKGEEFYVPGSTHKSWNKDIPAFRILVREEEYLASINLRGADWEEVPFARPMAAALPPLAAGAAPLPMQRHHAMLPVSLGGGGFWSHFLRVARVRSEWGRSCGAGRAALLVMIQLAWPEAGAGAGLQLPLARQAEPGLSVHRGPEPALNAHTPPRQVCILGGEPCLHGFHRRPSGRRSKHAQAAGEHGNG